MGGSFVLFPWLPVFWLFTVTGVKNYESQERDELT